MNSYPRSSPTPKHKSNREAPPRWQTFYNVVREKCGKLRQQPDRRKKVGGQEPKPCTIGALIITYAVLGVPYCNYSIIPQNPILIRKARILPCSWDRRLSFGACDTFLEWEVQMASREQFCRSPVPGLLLHLDLSFPPRYSILIVITS